MCYVRRVLFGTVRPIPIVAVAALVAGALLRVAVLNVAVPSVDDSWRAWSYHAATAGPAHLYGPRGHVVTFGDIEAPVVYPPLALDELAVIGRVHMALNHGRFPNDAGLTMMLKGTLTLMDAALTALMFVIVRRAAGARAAWWSAAAYWLNPAVLMITRLGYFDAFLALPAFGALVAASCGRPWVAGALWTAAVMTKPQGVLIAPAVALALWNAGDGAVAVKRLTAALAASGIAAALLVAPLVATGSVYFMMRSVAVLAGHDMLSALACNLWWVVSYLFEAAAVRGQGWRVALFAHPTILTHAYAIERGFPHPRIIGALLLAAAVCWSLKTAVRARDLGLHAALAAFLVDAYFTLSVQVHENHFVLVLPMLVLAAALRPVFAPVLAALSVSFALNLYLMFGSSGDGPPSAILSTGIDATLLLALVNCALCGWLAATLCRACRDADAGRGVPVTATA